MKEMTNQELAYQMQGILETLGADFAMLKAAVNPVTRREAMKQFGQRLVEWEDLSREMAKRLAEMK